MNDLSSAMQRVDAVGGVPNWLPTSDGNAPIRNRPKIAVPFPEPEADDIATEAKRRAETAACLRALARTVVALAMEAGGQDPRHWRAADALTAENIERLLIDCYEAKTVELPAAFRQASAPADIDRAAAVAKSLEGGQSP